MIESGLYTINFMKWRFKLMNTDLQKMYDNRFKVEEKNKKGAVWEEICKYLFKNTHREYNIIVDVAAGYCDFSNHIDYNCKKYAIDVNPDVKKYAKDGIEVIVDNIENLSLHFEENTISLFFMSNFLEHISKDAISRLLKTEYSLLESGGEVWILTPNIRYVGGKYWDFYDHITPITEKALMEEAELIGYKVKTCIPKFLPYTTKSRLPKAPWIVHLYLQLMPLSGRLFGEQSFLVLSKEDRTG